MTPILLLDEFLGASDADHGSPLVGSSGAELIRMLNEAGVLRLAPDHHASLTAFYKTPKPLSILKYKFK